ncbi:MAG: 4Fe-4S dicluster domain-containing protein [Defluviitaleaceae bacterium]|nr:4Fe-4S dicluster domain-containing protein [Defluviitaleaceae bacterium]
MWEKCGVCTKIHHPVGDEIIELENNSPRLDKNARFATVEAIEALSADDRFAFWQSQLSKCIRCNACRNTCPVCNCKRCVFSNNKYDMASKVNATEFEEQLFHIVRAFHVAGRCSDCGECSRVCPQDIPLHLLNRKIIKDINEFYGEYQAGQDIAAPEPLTSFDLNNDGQAGKN